MSAAPPIHVMSKMASFLFGHAYMTHAAGLLLEEEHEDARSRSGLLQPSEDAASSTVDKLNKEAIYSLDSIGFENRFAMLDLNCTFV